MQWLITGAYFATDQLAGIVVILDNVDITSFPRVSLYHRELAASKRPDGLWLAIEVVIVNLANQNPLRVLLHEIDLAVEIPVAINLDELIVLIGLQNVRAPIAVGVDQNLVLAVIDPI
ncbi:MAG TPA: hypothetical protein VJX23_01285 [Candidatus Binataceae bacterium]|nr:hypothetical protein [Candidatus Binataceae bacterium]